MRTPEADEALTWLAEHGVTPLGPDRWRQVDEDGDEEKSDNDLAHGWVHEALHDDRLAPAARLRLGLGFLDLLNDYWATTVLRWFLEEQKDLGLSDTFWADQRRRLEAVEPCEHIEYSLWVDWFEDHETSEAAFSAVLGQDLRELPDDAALAAGPLHRRSVRVLGCSGPVAWTVKADAYGRAAGVPELWPALFKGLLGSYHDLYGDLEPAAALALLDRMRLPAGTQHLARLRAVLAAGARNHYANPALWDA